MKKNKVPLLTIQWINDVLHCKNSFPKNFIFHSIQTDSRLIKPGDLFFDLFGIENENFIQDALDKGATGVIRKKIDSLGSLNTSHPPFFFSFPDPDPLISYRRLAKAWRQLFSLPVIVIAGSAGKSTTKEMCASLFSHTSRNILKTEKSENGFIGIPKTLLRLTQNHHFAFIEVGIDDVGSMEKHLDIIQPTASLLTSIGEEHLEKLIDLKTVLHEEGLALSFFLKKNGFVFINKTDPFIWSYFEKLSENFKGNACIYFLSSEDNQELKKKERSFCESKNIILGEYKKTRENNHWIEKIMMTPPSNKTVSFELPLSGKHNALNLLGALSIALHYKIPYRDMKKGLKNFSSLEGRSKIEIILPLKIQVICDYYNSQPLSLKTALTLFLEKTNEPEWKIGKKFACLGDMLELGENSSSLHLSFSSFLLNSCFDYIFLVGNQMKLLCEDLKKNKFSGIVKHFNSPEELSIELKKNLSEGDSILIKGSRGMKMESIWFFIK